MKEKVIIKTLLIFVLIVSVFNAAVNASTNEKTEGILDTYATDGTYKYSEAEKIYLPFARYAANNIIFDEKVDGFGSSFASQNIEVNSEVNGVQVLFAGDSIRVNDEMEYAVMFAKNDVTISSTINKSIIVFAAQKVTVTEDAIIKGDIICFSPNIEINGKVDGSVIGFADNTIINGTIEKDLRVATENIDVKDELVKGNVYVETSNNALKIENYKEAIVKYIEQQVESTKQVDFITIISALITAAVFTLLYYIINKNTKNEFMKNSLEKVKQNSTFVILSGALTLMTIPVMLFLFILISAFGLYMVSVPALIIYLAFILTVGLLSTFVVGALMSEYMSKTKYLENKDNKTKYLFTFAMYIVIYALARVPYIGGYVTAALVMIAIGAVLCIIFKKEKEVNNSNT